MDERTVITIGREFGSGGHEIGMKLAEKLGIKCYDKELLELAAKESGLCEELFASQDEKPTNSFLYSLVMDTYSLGYTNSYVDMPINHKVFLAQFDAIKKLATEYLEQDERMMHISKAMEKLTPHTRHILEECYIQRKKYQEVAEELNISVSAVRKHIVKALQVIREECAKKS